MDVKHADKPRGALKPAPRVFERDLTDEESAFLDENAAAIRRSFRRMAQDIWEIGRLLIEAKERIRHGHFLAHVASLGFSSDSAYRLMRVAERFPQIPQNAEFQLTALYDLAERLTP